MKAMKTVEWQPPRNHNGNHAVFSPSQPSWLNYDIEEVIEKFNNRFRTAIGTELHAYAEDSIVLSNKAESIKELRKMVRLFIFENNKFRNPVTGRDELTNYGRQILGQIRMLNDDVFDTLQAYINDAIGFMMRPEEELYYSDLFYGTADAISFRDGYLRIHDLKTGVMPAKIDQLETYAALFCLMYNVRPSSIEMELRIYQNREVLIHHPEPKDILAIVNKIRKFDRALTSMDEEN